MVFGLNRQRVFPETIVANNIVFHYSHSFETKDQAYLEAKYSRREGNYCRIIRKNGRYAVYEASKR